MIVPNKAVSIKQSSIYKIFYVLEYEFSAISVVDLYREVSSDFDGVADFVYALDVLYLLGKVKFDPAAGVLFKC